MDSPIARALREEQRAQEAALSPGERVRFALALGARDLRIYATARGLAPGEARRELRRSAQAGREPSRAAGGDLP